MFCTNCGSKLVDGAKFCSECGARVVRPEEPVFRTNPEIQFEEPKVAEPVVEAPVYDETPERPVREKVSFDWSNVVDEPHRKDVSDIKSPWATTGGIDEKEIYAEMTPPTGKSRTMSFIDILKAEKEEKEKAAAEKAIEYTEVLHFDPDLTAFDEAPQLHYAPLYDDVDEPVTTPFDIPEEEKAEPVFEEEPAFEEEPLFEEPKFDDFAEEPAEESAVEEPEFEEPAEEPFFEEPQYEEPQRMSEAAEEPELEVSRETIAQFDEYVKSFEKEAGIVSEPEFEEPAFEEPVIEEPVVEEPVVEEPVYEGPKFELPDFLKKVTGFAADKAEEPEAEEPVAEEPEFEEPEEEPAAEEFEPEEVEFEEPEFEPEFEPEVTPDIDELFAGLTPASQAAEEEPAEEPVVADFAPAEEVIEEVAEEAEPVAEEPVFEEPVAADFASAEEVIEEVAEEAEPVAEEPVVEEAFEEPKYDEGEYEEPAEAIESLEDLYLDFESAAPSGRTTRFDISAYDDEDDDDDEEEKAEEAVEEAEEAVEEFFRKPVDEEEDDEDEEEDKDDDDEEEKEDEEEGIDEDELFREMEETKPEVPGMTIAPPADKQEEIEALRKRLAELTGIDLYQVADLNAAMSLDELEEAEEPEGAVAEAPEEDNGDELFDEPSDDLFEVEVTPDIDELFAGLTPASVPDEPVVEEVFEEEPVIEEPVVEEPTYEDLVFAEPEVEDFVFEPEVTPDIDELFAELTPASLPDEPVIEEVFEEEPVAADFAPAEEVIEEAVEEAEPVAEEAAEDSVEDIYLQDFEPFERAPREFREEPEEIFEEEAEEAVDEAEPVVEEFAPVEEAAEEVAEEVAPVVEEAVEEPVVADFAPVEDVIEEAEPAVEEAVEEVAEVAEEPAPVVEEAPAAKETDALSLEELERDLFGEAPAEEVEAEETKKIDKFYTLYRKNEEFQRLLDEEYEKLRHGGGLTEEEKAAVDAVPKMADVEAAKAAAVAGAVGAVAAAAAAPAPAPEAVPVENKKAYRQVEDETIYMSKEELDAKLKAEAAAIAAANAPAEVPEDKAAKKKQEKKAKKKVEVEYEDVESGSKFLTVLAVIIALILIVLLAVILILQIAPDSGIAAWINSLIESITSRFGLVEPYMDQFLL